MKPGLVSGLVLLGAIALALGWYLRDDGLTEMARTTAIDSTEIVQSGADDSGVKSETELSAASAPGDSPEGAQSVEQLAQVVQDQSIIGRVRNFRTGLQAFIREAELLPAQDHEPRARELLAEVDMFAASGYLTGPEELALRLSLLRYALPADEYRTEASTLVSAARQHAEQSEREWATRADPRLETYRIEERRIVEQSAAMDEFPDGKTRQAYLRERLQALRSEIFTE